MIYIERERESVILSHSVDLICIIISKFSSCFTARGYFLLYKSYIISKKVGFWQRPFRDEKEMEMKPSCDIQSQNEALSGKTGSGKPIKCNSNIWR